MTELLKDDISFGLDTEKTMYDEEQNQFLSTQAGLADADDNLLMAKQRALTEFRRGNEQQVRSRLFAQETEEVRKSTESIVTNALRDNDTATAEQFMRAGLENLTPDERIQMEVSASENLDALAMSDPDTAKLALIAEEEPQSIRASSQEQALKASIIRNWLRRFEARSEETGAIETVFNVLGFLVPFGVTGTQLEGFDFLAGTSMAEQAARLHQASVSELPALLEELEERIQSDSGTIPFGENEMISKIAAESIVNATPDSAYIHDMLGTPLDLVGLGVYKGGYNVAKYLLMGGNGKMAGQAVASQVSGDAAEHVAVYEAVGVKKAGDLNSDLSSNVRKILDNLQTSIDQAWQNRVFAPRIDLGTDDIENMAEYAQNLARYQYGDDMYNATIPYMREGVWVQDVLMGTKSGAGFKTKLAAQSSAARRGLPKEGYETVPIPDGSWMIRVRQNIDETGFYGNSIDTQAAGNWFTRWAMSGASAVKQSIVRNSTSGKLESAKFQELNQEMNKVFNSLKKKERAALANVINIGKQTPLKEQADGSRLSGVWYNEVELDQIYVQVHGRVPSEAEKLGYFTYRKSSDFNHALENDIMWRRYSSQGYNTQHFSGEANKSYIGKAVLPHEVKDTQRVLDWDGQVITRLDELPEDKIIIRLSDRVDFDGNSVRYITANKTSWKQTQLQRELIPYTAGGTRNYLGKWFVKHWDGQKSNKPSTYGVFASRRAATEYVKELESVRDLYRLFSDQAEGLGEANLARLEAKFEAKLQEITDDFETWDALDDAVTSGRFSADGKIKTNFDGEVFGSADEGLTSFGEMHQVGDGKLYYSHRGDFLKGEESQAWLINPFKALSRQQGHVAHNAGMQNFAIGEMNRWAEQFGKYLAVPSKNSPSPEEIFLKGEFQPGTPQRVIEQGNSMKMFINRAIGTPTQSDAQLRALQQNAAKWLEEGLERFNLPDSAHQKAANAITDPLINGQDPVGILKGWAYDLHLGIFNMGQLFLQGSAALGAIAVSPRYGMASMHDWFYLRAATLNVHAKMPMARAWSSLTGKTEADFLSMVDDLERTGISNIGFTDTVIDRATTTNAGGSVSAGFQKLRNIGRVPVYEGERIGRFTAFGIARREALDKVAEGAFKQGDDAYISYIQGRTSDLNLNMISGAESALQRGQWTALGSQFWAYPTRVIESLMGAMTKGKVGNKTLTPAENGKFILGQGLLWGTMGIPGVDYIKDTVLSASGEQIDEEVYQTMTTGFMDFAIRKLSNGTLDPALGANIGTSRFLEDSYNKLFSERSAIGLLGGVAAADALKLMDVYSRMTMMSENEKVGSAEFTDQLVSELGKLIKTRNNFVRAMYLHKYGVLLNARGETALTSEGPMNSLIVSLGFPTWEEFQYYSVSKTQREHFEMVKDVASMVAETRLKYAIAITEGDVKKQEVLYKVQAGLLQVHDHEIRKKILREASVISKRLGHSKRFSDAHLMNYRPNKKEIQDLQEKN